MVATCQIIRPAGTFEAHRTLCAFLQQYLSIVKLIIHLFQTNYSNIMEKCRWPYLFSLRRTESGSHESWFCYSAKTVSRSWSKKHMRSHSPEMKEITRVSAPKSDTSLVLEDWQQHTKPWQCTLNEKFERNLDSFRLPERTFMKRAQSQNVDERGMMTRGFLPVCSVQCMDQINIKTPNPKYRLVFNRVYRLEIQAAMLIFSTPLVNSSNLFNGWPPPPSIPSV